MLHERRHTHTRRHIHTIHTVSFYLYEVQKQAKLSYGDKS